MRPVALQCVYEQRSNNIAVAIGAGAQLTTGDNNIDIGQAGEFLKEHRSFIKEQRKVEDQQKEIDVLKN